jgi:hypothetical protein
MSRESDDDLRIGISVAIRHLANVRGGLLEGEDRLLRIGGEDGRLAVISAAKSTIEGKTGLMLAIENDAELETKEAQAMLTMLCEAEERVMKEKGDAYSAPTDREGKTHWDYLLEYDEVPLALEIARGVFTNLPQRIIHAPNSRRHSQTSMDSTGVGMSV